MNFVIMKIRDKHIRKFSLRIFSRYPCTFNELPDVNELPDKDRERERIRTFQKVAY